MQLSVIIITYYLNSYETGYIILYFVFAGMFLFFM